MTRKGLSVVCLALAWAALGCGSARPKAADAPASPAAEPAGGDYALGEAQGAPAATDERELRVDSGETPGQPKEPQWAEPPPRPEPGTVAEAMADLEEDEEMLMSSLDDAKKAMELAGGPDGAPGACRRVCSAIVSMRRSVAAVCRLAGEEDARCDRARATLERSEDRVADAGCGCGTP